MDDFQTLLKRKIKRRNDKLGNQQKKQGSKNEREITFYYKEAKSIIYIESIIELKIQLSKMIYPFYKIIEGNIIKKIYLNKEEDVGYFFKMTKINEVYEDINQKEFLSIEEFNSFHIYNTKFEKFSDISPNYQKYFMYKNDDKFYIKKPTQIDLSFMIYIDGQIDTINLNFPLKMYGPIGCGKTSVLLFLHGRGKGIKNINNVNEYYFRSSLYLNLNYYMNVNNDLNDKKKVLEEELCCLFTNFEKYKNFIIECIHLGYLDINYNIENNNFIEKINSIIGLFVNSYKITENTINEDVILIIDEYSSKYDKNKFIKKIEQQYKEEKFCLLISRSLETQDDINEFINDYYNAPNFTCQEELITSFFYNKNFTDIPNDIINNSQFMNNFGKNYFYYEKYKNSKKDIDTFIKQEKSDLLEELSPNKDNLSGFQLFITGLLLNLNKIKLDESMKLILKLLPLKYLYLERLDKENIKVQTYIPLLEQLIKENFVNDLILFSKSELIYSLVPNLFGIVFEQIIHYKLNFIDSQLFELSRKSIKVKSIYDGKNILKSTIVSYVKNFTKKNIDNSINIYSLNQEFNGERVDEGLIIKNNNKVSLVLSQTKTGKSFTFSKDELLLLPFELFYVTKKIEKITGLLIKNIYFHLTTNIDNTFIEDLCLNKNIDLLYYNLKESIFCFKREGKYYNIDNVNKLLNSLRKINMPIDVENKYLFYTNNYNINVNPFIKRIKSFFDIRNKTINLKGVLMFYNQFETIKINSNEIIFIRAYVDKKYRYFIYDSRKVINELNENNKGFKIDGKNFVKIINESKSFFILLFSII